MNFVYYDILYGSFWAEGILDELRAWVNNVLKRAKCSISNETVSGRCRFAH